MVFPARAGMIPTTRVVTGGGESIPRESGDDPSDPPLPHPLCGYSPRERG